MGTCNARVNKLYRKKKLKNIDYKQKSGITLHCT